MGLARVWGRADVGWKRRQALGQQSWAGHAWGLGLWGRLWRDGLVSFGAAKMGLDSSPVSVQGQHSREWVACFSVSDPGSHVALTSVKVWHHLQVWGRAVTGSRILEPGKAEIKVPADPVSGKGPLPGL